MRFLLLACAVFISTPAAPAQEDSLQSLLQRAFESSQHRDYKSALPLFEKALERATAESSVAGQAAALRGIGVVQNARGNFPDAHKSLSRAVELCSGQSVDPLCRARAQNDLAYTEWATGKISQAVRLYEEALKDFEAAGDRNEIAKLLYNLAFLTSPATPLRLTRIVAAIEAANAINDKRLSGKSHHLWGDTLYNLGDLRSAVSKLETALALLDTPADRGDRARVLISFGRLYSAHLRPGLARPFYEQALSIHRELGDKQAVVYSLGNLASTASAQGQFDQATQLADEATAIARSTGSKSLLSSALFNLASHHLTRREFQPALDLLRESLTIYDDRLGARWIALGRAHLGLKQPAEALDASAKALALSVKLGYDDTTAEGHFVASRALDGLGRLDEAAAELRKALEIRENLRTKIIPTDALKRGYGASGAGLFDHAVDLFFRLGLREEALTAAEQARARAFLDLLASRSLQDKARLAKAPPPAHGQSNPAAEEPHIVSFAAVAPPTIASIRKAAVDSQTTLLIYYTTAEALFTWVVPPSGNIQAVRVNVSASQLEKHIRAATQPNQASAISSLHRLLIQPVAATLGQPAARHLTIVAHGPLNRLSFAAIRNPRGRYFIEDHIVSYIPSASMLALPPAAHPFQTTAAGFLLVADPKPMPGAPGGGALPALAGALRESTSVAKAARGHEVTLLTGHAAAEQSVRQSLGSHQIIHFATHGILIDDNPFDSFLALGSQPGGESADGRLTVREIYDLKLADSLIVMSACRSAAGPVTGDGVAGLARAFFYAGASTLVATLWDVADEPTSWLVTRFYHHLLKGAAPGLALHNAQIEMLSMLRRGQIATSTPVGPIVLPEDPAYWAGFVIMGRS
jgi:CHAT domain-containing protein/Tfp pilus assembly protein PilF